MARALIISTPYRGLELGRAGSHNGIIAMEIGKTR